MENKLINKDEITSLELLEQINIFREQEGNRAELQHYDLLKIIRDEFSEEINEQKILPVEYKDKKGEKRPMYNLTYNQAKQILVRESKYVRRAVIHYIEKLEQIIKEFPEKEKILIDFEKTVEAIANVYGCKKDLKTIPLKDLKQLKEIIEKNFKEEKPQEILKDLAQDIYYIFKVDKEETPLLTLKIDRKTYRN